MTNSTGSGAAGSRRRPKETPDREIEFSWGLQIPLRDGTKLNGTLYRPKGARTRLSCVFTLTPYVADTYHERAVYFARKGYAFVLVDCRGRGNSQGTFEPFAGEGSDGYDVVEWLASQDWSNGEIAMWGGSYAGFDQWSTLKEFPPHLKTIVPAASAYPALDYPFFRNIGFPYEMQWETLTSGRAANNAIFGDIPFWIEKFRDHFLSHRAFRDLDKTIGNTSTIFRKLLEHRERDAYWSAMVPSPDQYRKIRVPILTITGHYDGDQPGALEYYKNHMKYGSPEAKRWHYLVVGPWDHPGTRTPKKEVGGLTFGEASLVNLNQLHKEWYDWTLKRGPKPQFLKKRVAYYVVGAEIWKYAESLEEISKKKLTLYLDSPGGGAIDAFRSGVMRGQRPEGSHPDEFVYDPLDVRPAEVERVEVKNFITDQRYAINLFGAGLVYHSEPFAEDTEITGSPRFVVWMAMDVPDTDFWVRLYEILVDGTSVLLTDDALRARYRKSLTAPELVRPREVNRYEFSSFLFLSRRIAKGSRLRLVLRSPNSIFWEKNYNSGGDVAQETGSDARTAHVKVYHDAEHLSCLEIPIVG